MRRLQEWDDEQATNKSEAEFQQRILASSYGPHDPKLYWRLFEPEEVDGEQFIPGAGKILQPTSIEEFEAMLDMWDSESGLNDIGNLFSGLIDE